MKRMGLLFAGALVAASILAGCVVAVEEHPYRGYYRPYPYPYYSYYHHPGYYYYRGY